MGECFITRRGGGKPEGQYAWKKYTDSTKETFIGYVVDSNENAYPNYGLQGGYWYESIDIPVPYEQLINYTMLYDEGDECIDVTGGWGISGYTIGSVVEPNWAIRAGEKNATNLKIKGVANKSTELFGNLNPVPENYTNLGVIATSTFGVNQCVAVMASQTKSLVTDTDVANWDIGRQAYPNKTLFSASLTNQRYIAIAGWYSTGSSISMYNAFLTKADDWQTLCTKAGVTAPVDLATLIADSTSLSTILSNEDAVNYMVAQCTGDFMASAIGSSTFLTALDSSPHKTTVQANEHWAKFLAMVA